MDIAEIFRGISSQLSQDFHRISSQMNHGVSKGSYREGILKKFLEGGKLPKKFGIGSGQIIDHLGHQSKASDIIIYDQIEGISFIYSDEVQVYPVESIYGIIEVKSCLSKEKLIDSLENIKSVKSLFLSDYTTKINNGVLISHPRPRPFGIIFAYSLASNSIESLTKNLIEWEQDNDKLLWSNLVVVLEEGIIYHYRSGSMGQRSFSNESILQSTTASYVAYREDTLYHFYSILIDLCSGMSLGSINLNQYFNPPEIIGKYIVDNRTQYRFNLHFIEKLVQSCRKQGKITQQELFLKQMGSIPNGMDQDYLDYEVYFYNPENLPGIHEVNNPWKREGDYVVASQKMTCPSDWIKIDGEIYYFPLAYINEESDIELRRK